METNATSIEVQQSLNFPSIKDLIDLYMTHVVHVIECVLLNNVITIKEYVSCFL